MVTGGIDTALAEAGCSDRITPTSAVSSAASHFLLRGCYCWAAEQLAEHLGPSVEVAPFRLAVPSRSLSRFPQHRPQRRRERDEGSVLGRGVVHFGSCERLARPLPAIGTDAPGASNASQGRAGFFPSRVFYPPHSRHKVRASMF